MIGSWNNSSSAVSKIEYNACYVPRTERSGVRMQWGSTNEVRRKSGGGGRYLSHSLICGEKSS